MEREINGVKSRNFTNVFCKAKLLYILNRKGVFSVHRSDDVY